MLQIKSKVTFYYLSNLNYLYVLFVGYRFALSSFFNISKAIIGSSIVRSAAYIVKDNAYRVVLTCLPTLAIVQRASIGTQMIGVARWQKLALDEIDMLVPAVHKQLAVHAKLPQ